MARDARQAVGPGRVTRPTWRKRSTPSAAVCSLSSTTCPASMENSMPDDQQSREDLGLTRRDMLRRGGMGMGALALAGVMGDAFAGDATHPAGNLASPLAPRQPHFAARAKRVIHLFMNGGPSHLDTFDPKPALERYHGQQLPASMHLVTSAEPVRFCGLPSSSSATVRAGSRSVCFFPTSGRASTTSRWSVPCRPTCPTINRRSCS